MNWPSLNIGLDFLAPAELIDHDGLRPSAPKPDITAEYMPYPIFAEMTDEELEAIWLYLQSLPPKEFGNR